MPQNSRKTVNGGYLLFVIPPTLARNTCFYAVRVGRVPGVYVEWCDAAPQVNKYTGNIHKKFSTFDAAASFVWGPSWASMGPWYYHPGGASAIKRRASYSATSTPSAGASSPSFSSAPLIHPLPEEAVNTATPVHCDPRPFPANDLPLSDLHEAILDAAHVDARPGGQYSPTLPRNPTRSAQTTLRPSSVSTASTFSSDVDNITTSMANADLSDALPTRLPGFEVPRRSLKVPVGLVVDGDVSNLSDRIIAFLDHHRWDDAALDIIAAVARVTRPRNVVKFKVQLAKSGMSEWEAGVLWEEMDDTETGN